MMQHSKWVNPYCYIRVLPATQASNMQKSNIKNII